nr:MAG TPA: hypothetical protein [Bacteriophage sp.]
MPHLKLRLLVEITITLDIFQFVLSLKKWRMIINITSIVTIKGLKVTIRRTLQK